MAKRTKKGQIRGRVLTAEQIRQHLRHLSGGGAHAPEVAVKIARTDTARQATMFSGDPHVSPAGRKPRRGIRGTEIAVELAPTLEGLSIASRRIVSVPRDIAVERVDRILSGPSKLEPLGGSVQFTDVYRAIQGAQTAFEAADWYHRHDLRDLFVKASQVRETGMEHEYLSALMRVARGDALLPSQNSAMTRIVQRNARMIEQAVVSGGPVDALIAATRLTYALRGYVEQEPPEQPPQPGGDEASGVARALSGAQGNEGASGVGESESGTGDDPTADEAKPSPQQQAEDTVRAIEPAIKAYAKDIRFLTRHDLTGIRNDLQNVLGDAFSDLEQQVEARDDPAAGASPALYEGIEIIRPPEWVKVIASPAIGRIVAAARGGSGLPPMKTSGAPTRKVWGLKYGMTNVFARPPQSAAHRFILVDDSGSMDGPPREAAYQIASAVAMSDPAHSHILAFSTGKQAARLAIAEVPTGFKPPRRTFGGGTPLCVALEYLQNYMAGRLRDAVAVIITDAGNGGGVHPGVAGPCHPSQCLMKHMTELSKTGMRYSAVLIEKYTSGHFPGVPDERVVVLDASEQKDVVRAAAKALAIVSGNAALAAPEFVADVLARSERGETAA